MSNRTISISLLALAALGLASCPLRQGVAPTRVSPVSSVATGSAIPGASLGSWVVFHHVVSKNYGIDIQLDTPSLPALSSDGTRLLVPDHDTGYGQAPSLRIIILRVADESVVLSLPILHAGELDDVARVVAVTVGQRRQYAVDHLIAKIEARIEHANQVIGPGSWMPLSKCWPDDPNRAFPPCSLPAQNISCGTVLRGLYRDHTLDVWDREHRARLPRPGWASPPVINSDGGSISVRECFGGVWIAPERGLLLGELWPTCQEAGDWCYPPLMWRIVKLPFVPKPAVAPSATKGPTGCPDSMTAIPAGTLTMGSSDGFDEERPPHMVHVDAFCMDTTEVTVADYAACVKSGWCFEPPRGCNFEDPGRRTHPVNCVPLPRAEVYCAWAGKRLPTEAEWEYAARGPAGRKYPSGDGEPGEGVCWRREKNAGTCAAGASPADRSPFGIFDMTGNIAEWTSSPFTFDYSDTGTSSKYVQRGGHWWLSDPRRMRAAYRGQKDPWSDRTDDGFRCAMSHAP
jgi:formylglycine-generating enzyme required for sulfatase activity